jgi:hypothetical protein
LDAVAQAEVPLQLLTPSHFTFASSADALVTATVENAKAAAVASATFDKLRFLIVELPDLWFLGMGCGTARRIPPASRPPYRRNCYTSVFLRRRSDGLRTVGHTASSFAALAAPEGIRMPRQFGFLLSGAAAADSSSSIP